MNSFSTLKPDVCECGVDHTAFNDSELTIAQLEMRTLRPWVATPATIMDLRGKLAGIASGAIDQSIIITGPCHEPVGDLDSAAAASIQRAKIIATSALADALVIQRDRGQNTKPRSTALELSPDGHLVPAFHGDAVNTREWKARQPNPARLLNAAVQASHVEHALRQSLGRHVPAAHEFLNLAFEAPQLRRIGAKLFACSADLPWIGVRNTDSNGDHFNLLQAVENPVGFKVSHEISAEQIKTISAKMNAAQHPGKLVWMLRLGLEHIDHAPRILEAITTQSAPSTILYDIHGSTRSDESGNRIRCVDEITEEVAALSSICKQHGVRLNGLHLETTVDNARFECIDHAGETPTHEGNIDPQLNPTQTLRVLAAAKEVL